MKHLFLCALSALLVLASCASNDDNIETQYKHTHLTLSASNHIPKTSRVSLTEKEDKLEALWEENDEVSLFNRFSIGQKGTTLTAKMGGKGTILEGAIPTSKYEEGSKIVVIYPKVDNEYCKMFEQNQIIIDPETGLQDHPILLLDLSKQDGKLSTIAKKTNFVIGEGSIKSLSSDKATGSIDGMTHLTTTCRFNFLKEWGEPINNIKRIQIKNIITQIAVTFDTEKYYWTGDATPWHGGNNPTGKIIIENPESNSVYVSLFTGRKETDKYAPEFVVETKDGDVYEAKFKSAHLRLSGWYPEINVRLKKY
ncbi:MAG TPA: hypothetical protein VIQ97_03275 [Prevotella sp.]